MFEDISSGAFGGCVWGSCTAGVVADFAVTWMTRVTSDRSKRSRAGRRRGDGKRTWSVVRMARSFRCRDLSGFCEVGPLVCELDGGREFRTEVRNSRGDGSGVDVAITEVCYRPTVLY
jgi:hypothetical protein